MSSVSTYITSTDGEGVNVGVGKISPEIDVSSISIGIVSVIFFLDYLLR